MNSVFFTLTIFCAALVQFMAPAPAWLGCAKPPVLLSVALYAALRRETAVALSVAFACGLAHDLLDCMPLGYGAAMFVWRCGRRYSRFRVRRAARAFRSG